MWKRWKIKPQGVPVSFIVPVLPPPEKFNEEAEGVVVPQDDTIEMQGMAALLGDMELEDDELLLVNDIANHIVEEAEI